MVDNEMLQAISKLIDAKINPINERLDSIENKVDNLERQVQRNTLTVENTINQCIKVLGEGYHLNAERFDRIDIDGIKNKSEQAVTMSLIANEKIDRLIEKINESA